MYLVSCLLCLAAQRKGVVIKMNDLQKVEFDLFKCFVDTCEKLHLDYFMLEGSALGAARHGGFIPWDDDLDVGMYREDYDKFMELAPALLPDGIFLQNYKTDPKYPQLYAKLRNSNTTYIEKSVKEYDINHGIYIDIFPLDGFPETHWKQKKLAFLKGEFLRRIWCGKKEARTIKWKLYSCFLRILGFHKRVFKTLRRYEAVVSRHSVAEASKICNHGSPYGEKDYIAAEYYGRGSYATFEGMKVKVPKNVDGYLTSLYGDWRTPPPPEKQKGHHYYEICDTERPFTYYTKQENRK